MCVEDIVCNVSVVYFQTQCTSPPRELNVAEYSTAAKSSASMRGREFIDSVLFPATSNDLKWMKMLYVLDGIVERFVYFFIPL